MDFEAFFKDELDGLRTEGPLPRFCRSRTSPQGRRSEGAEADRL
ncbi:hypothetical protein [Rhizobium leguminosarum]|nr:hypothetical protein [Rhizobium leguminosarum]